MNLGHNIGVIVSNVINSNEFVNIISCKTYVLDKAINIHENINIYFFFNKMITPATHTMRKTFYRVDKKYLNTINQSSL